MIATEEKIRLNLGGRDTRIPGFLNVDLHEGKNVDIHSDASDLNTIATGSVSDIYASNILEHWPHVKTVYVLEEWHRVLQPGGKLYISVPDFDAIIKTIKTEGLTQWTVNLLWGDQIYPLAFHYVCFNFATLAKAVMAAGFSDIKRLKFLPQNVKDCSRIVNSHTLEPICLNVECLK